MKLERNCKMNQCNIYCINTSKDIIADILEHSSKRIKVAMPDTSITIVLIRKDIRYPYVGFIGELEFETFGELE
jgi:hypothetical protein